MMGKASPVSLGSTLPEATAQ
ncbi:hypothetical protein ACLB1R_33940 [Escherichia coli]